MLSRFLLLNLKPECKQHLRREERHQTNTKVKFSGELLIDYSEKELFIYRTNLYWSCKKRIWTLLSYYLKTQDKFLDKERIYERVWGYYSEGDSSVVAEHIRRIRTKIAAYTNKSYIETVWGCGYKWIR